MSEYREKGCFTHKNGEVKKGKKSLSSNSVKSEERAYIYEVPSLLTHRL